MHNDDPVVAPLIDAARDDPSTIGLILHGSRGAGMGDEESDYDLIWVLTDHGFERAHIRPAVARG